MWLTLEVLGPRPLSLLEESKALAIPGDSGDSVSCLGWGLGLAKSPSPRAQEVAFQLAQNWIRTNFEVSTPKSQPCLRR